MIDLRIVKYVKILFYMSVLSKAFLVSFKLFLENIISVEKTRLTNYFVKTNAYAERG